MTSDWAIEIHNERMESDPSYAAACEIEWMSAEWMEVEQMEAHGYSMDASGEVMFPMFIGD